MDDVDLSNERQQNHDEASIAAARAKAADIPEGVAGECCYCGEHFERLVNSACGRCRDEYKIK